MTLNSITASKLQRKNEGCPKKAAGSETVENTLYPCVSVVWSASVTFLHVVKNQYEIVPNDFQFSAPSIAVKNSLFRIASYVCDDVETKDIISISNKNSARFMTMIVRSDGAPFEDYKQRLIMGMTHYFAAAIHDSGSPNLFSQLAGGAIDELPDEHLTICSGEAKQFLVDHGFKNVGRKFAVESGEYSVVVEKAFSPRPRPDIRESSIILENTQVVGITHSSSTATLLPKGGKKLGVNVVGNKLETYAKLNAAASIEDNPVWSKNSFALRYQHLITDSRTALPLYHTTMETYNRLTS